MRRFALLVSLALPAASVPAADGPHLATGVKVGEVTTDSAIVWVRLTRDAERKFPGVREPRKREPRMAEYTPSETRVEDREGAAPGMPGEVRLKYAGGTKTTPNEPTEWITVAAATDFTHQFALKDLEPNGRYAVEIEVRPVGGNEPTASTTATFHTAAEPDVWQDVTFTVVTGQSYWDLDHEAGYHVYPAMQKLEPRFIVPTGDTVYLDSEAPRARTVELARHHWHRMYSLPRHVEFHRHVPGYWEVDDHDTWVNDGWPTMTARWMNPLTFDQGFGVYTEQVPMGRDLYRTFRWGKGLQVWVVEGRRYRSPNNAEDGPEKSIWGREQREWLKRTLLESDADFKVLVSPTPIVGPDRSGKKDNHANSVFQWEGDHFRNWTRENREKLGRFHVCCGDRHWQYVSVDPKTGLREFSCGPVSDKHAGGNPARADFQEFLRVKGGFLSVNVTRNDAGTPTIAFRHHDVRGEVVNEYTETAGGD